MWVVARDKNGTSLSLLLILFRGNSWYHQVSIPILSLPQWCWSLVKWPLSRTSGKTVTVHRRGLYVIQNERCCREAGLTVIAAWSYGSESSPRSTNNLWANIKAFQDIYYNSITSYWTPPLTGLTTSYTATVDAKVQFGRNKWHTNYNKECRSMNTGKCKLSCMNS